MSVLRFGSLVLGFSLVSTSTTNASPRFDEDPNIKWETFEGQARSGQVLEGRLGRIAVPENRQSESDATIDLAFVVYKSTNPDPGPPIFYFIGGPGGPGVDYTAEEALNPVLPLLEFGDVVGIDQRGTGHTVPNLSEGGDSGFELPMDKALTREALIKAQSGAIRACYDHWKKKGVDLSAYNSRESADDFEDVRRALGYERIVTWGTSYGSHLSLAYLRRHGEHVERAVLMKVEGPNHTFKLPSQVQGRLDHLHDLVAKTPELAEKLPDLKGTIGKLLQQLQEEEVVVVLRPPSGGEYPITVGPFDLQLALAMQMADTRNQMSLPSRVHQLAQGDWTMLGLAAMNLRRGGASSAMQIMMDYSSWATAARLAQIEKERKDPKNLLGDALSYPYFPESAAACGNPDLGDAFREPFDCDVPVLFVSGDMDARTPISNVEELLPGFSNAAHIIVRGTGHDARELESEEYVDLVKAFLYGDEIESCTIELAPPQFAPLR